MQGQAPPANTLINIMARAWHNTSPRRGKVPENEASPSLIIWKCFTGYSKSATGLQRAALPSATESGFGRRFSQNQKE